MARGGKIAGATAGGIGKWSIGKLGAPSGSWALRHSGERASGFGAPAIALLLLSRSGCKAIQRMLLVIPQARGASNR